MGETSWGLKLMGKIGKEETDLESSHGFFEMNVNTPAALLDETLNG